MRRLGRYSTRFLHPAGGPGFRGLPWPLSDSAMLVSWNWLKEYVRLDMSVETLTERLLMSGLNLEEVTDVDGDIAIDLEVTSNRPDCLGHLGIAREVGALFERQIKIPAAQPRATGEPVSNATAVEIQCLDLCPRYTARVIRGVRIGPSPPWLRRRLTTLGIRPINNVVDCTNYVMMECGQPLHAFDFDTLHGGRIVVRQPFAGEKITAIDQKEYPLSPEMCIIADADRPVAVAGVMGGLETEINDRTTNVLLEAAEFAPRAIRAAARKLNLHSPSSYRFERGIDASQLDWASRRCAELILETAGGELLSGEIAAGSPPPPAREPITLRHHQVRRILGIEIPRDEVVRILLSLGLILHDNASPSEVRLVPPSWRRDLTREIDLIEEAARIYGYERIPENVPVPLTVSTKTIRDRVQERIAGLLVAHGFFEAVTVTFVDEQLHGLLQPWGEHPPLRVDHSSRRKENILRQSVVPSLLASRRENERHGNFDARLFEMAKVFLSADPGQPQAEPSVIAFVGDQPFGEMKGIVEQLAAVINRSATVLLRPAALAGFAPGRTAEVLINGEPWGWLGEISADTRTTLGLRDATMAAELRMDLLDQLLDQTPPYQPVPPYPGMDRDLNFVLDEAVSWQELAEVVTSTAGPLLATIGFGGQYRGPQIPADKKSYVVTLHYRAADRTLTAAEVDAAQQAVIQACTVKLGASLR